MSIFIEIPLILKDNDVDYEALGIKEDAEVGIFSALLNVDDIQRVNDTDRQDAEIVIWTRDGLCYYSTITFDELKELIL